MEREREREALKERALSLWVEKKRTKMANEIQKQVSGTHKSVARFAGVATCPKSNGKISRNLSACLSICLPACISGPATIDQVKLRDVSLAGRFSETPRRVEDHSEDGNTYRVSAGADGIGIRIWKPRRVPLYAARAEGSPVSLQCTLVAVASL